MKICKINNYTFPARNAQGSQRVLEALSQEFIKQGHQVDLFINQDSIIPEKFGKLVDKIEDDVDIVHIHGGLPHELGLDLNKPWVTTAHGGATDTSERMIEVGKYTKNIIFVSKFCSQMYGSDCFIYTCANPDDFIYQQKKDDFFLWMAGTDWSNQKGLFDSISLAKKLGVKLKIAGGGKNTMIIDEIKRSCDRKIEYLGFVNGKEKSELLSAAKALLMAGTIFDACPLTNIEAWASGTPVIARNVGVHPEIVKSDVGVICASPGDFSRAMLTIEKIKSEDCRKYFMENFTSEIAAQKHLQIYEKMIKYGKL